MSDDLIGKQLGGYAIIEQIGRGGMATVYRANQTSMNRTVALKVLPRHFMRDNTYIQRFEREVQIVAQLEHRNIIPVYDYGESDGQPFIAMRYMPAGSVDDLLHKGPLSPERTLKIVEQIAPALDYAHTKGVLHRDLKPSNILLDDDGGAYITDFGIARIAGTDGATITTQGVVGTPSYMSPEQAQGKKLDGRSDVYSLGVMLFELMTGRRPFENETPYGIAVMQVTTPPPNPRSINPKITAAVEQVILKSLKKKPENRYQTAVNLAEALKMAIERPESVHDTQPHPIYIGDNPSEQPYQQHTPPERTMPALSVQPAVPSGPIYTPPGSQSNPPVGWDSRLRPIRQKNNFWRNLVIGSFLGCGLLSAVIFGLLIVVGDLLENNPDETDTNNTAATQSVTAEATSKDITKTPLPTFTLSPLDLTSEAGRQTLVGSAATLTPLPIGVRDTGTPDGNLENQPQQLVYFATADDFSHLFLYDLETGETIQLTQGDVVNSYPMASPDGTLIAFQSQRDDDFDIYVMNVNTLNTIKLTNNDELDRLPAWSPDGRWLVYSSDTRGDENHDIYRIRSTGGDPELLISNGQRNSHPRYSPDGEQIVFTSGLSGDANTWEIILYNLNTGQQKPLTSNTVRDASPTFSPDGQSILYITNTNGGYSLTTIDVDGSKPITLYETRAFIWGANYSPDGAFITFNAEENGISTLYIMRADGTDLQTLENGGGFYPSWVP